MDLLAIRSTRARLFVAPNQLEVDGRLELVAADTVLRLGRVLRLRDGDVVSVSGGESRWRMTSVASRSGWECEAGLGL